ncbi:MAG: hypothetical protein WCC11_04210 [Gammaproteobacteria bacterium]
MTCIRKTALIGVALLLILLIPACSSKHATGQSTAANTQLPDNSTARSTPPPPPKSMPLTPRAQRFLSTIISSYKLSNEDGNSIKQIIEDKCGGDIVNVHKDGDKYDAVNAINPYSIVNKCVYYQGVIQQLLSANTASSISDTQYGCTNGTAEAGASLLGDYGPAMMEKVCSQANTYPPVQVDFVDDAPGVNTLIKGIAIGSPPVDLVNGGKAPHIGIINLLSTGSADADN